MPDSLRELQQLVAGFRDARDWKQFHSPRNLAAAISIEAAELQELFLWMRDDETSALLATKDGREKVSDEIADILAFVLAFADATGIDIAAALDHKMKKNALKYPSSKVKGSAKKYTHYKPDA